MAFGTRVAFEALREKAFGDVTSSFTALGTPLADHCRLVSFNNETNVDLYLSFDGSTNHLRIAANSFKLLDLSANKIRDDGLFLPTGLQISVKDTGLSATSGLIWAEVMFADGGK